MLFGLFDFQHTLFTSLNTFARLVVEIVSIPTRVRSTILFSHLAWSQQTTPTICQYSHCQSATAAIKQTRWIFVPSRAVEMVSTYVTTCCALLELMIPSASLNFVLIYNRSLIVGDFARPRERRYKSIVLKAESLKTSPPTYSSHPFCPYIMC